MEIPSEDGVMTETTDRSDMPSPDHTEEETVEDLRERVEVLETQNREMENKLLDAAAEKNRAEQQLDRVTRENTKLKKSPLFIATVQELTEDEVIVKQHGNNQEALTDVTEEMLEDLEAGDRVTVNNNLAVTGKLDKETDARAQAMQVEESPTVSYADIGGIDEQIEEVRETIEMPLESPEVFDSVGIDPPSGVLLHGPPGTGKTMLAKAVANETDATFIRMAASELVHKFIGEGSKLVRDLFEVARENGPSVLFIDEIDAIASERTDSKTSGDAEVQRTLMQLLAELDGFDDRGDVRIIAATNRLDMLDDAILRPGRFDRLMEVPAAGEEGREDIFEIHTREMNVDDDVDTSELASSVGSITGAEIRAVCTEAGMNAIRAGREMVEMCDFRDAYAELDDGEEETVAMSGPTAFA
jgi:proteasome regulatory subunit